MASLKIERSFSVDAPPDRVWTFLTDPARVVTCLPGAALSSSSEDGLRHEGTVTVKLGTISVTYRGTADFIEIDAERRRLQVRAKGREKVGAGSASLSMVSDVLASDDGSEVAIEADIEVTGKIVALGRGMIGVVSEQVVKDFATNVCRAVSAPADGLEGDTDTGEPDPSTSGGAEQATMTEPAPASGLSILFRALWSRIRRLFEPT